MPDEVLKDENHEMKTAVESIFPLEITPDKLVVPPDGVLEVKVKNPTAETKTLIVHFNSFFFLMQMGDRLWMASEGCSISSLLACQTILPGETLVLKIGYLHGEYKGKCSTVDEEILMKEGETKVIDATPNKRIYYNYERPEGYVCFVMGGSKEQREMPLYLEEETEKYNAFKEQFLMIRKNQKRRARWGQILVNYGHQTSKMYMSFGGRLCTAADINELNFPKFHEEATKRGWEDDILENLEDIDKYTDKQIAYGKQKKIEEREFKWEDERLESWMAHQSEEEERDRQKVKEYEKKFKVKRTTDVKVQTETDGKSRASETPAQKTQEVHKSSISKATEAPKSRVQTVKPVELTVKKSVEVEKKEIGKKKEKKKKKANPCCVLM